MVKFTVGDYIARHNSVVESLDFREIESAISIIQDTVDKGGRVAVCGNGGSAIAASHYITDWNKMVYSHTGTRFNGICLSDNVGLVTAYSNDLSYDFVFSEQVKNLLTKGDLLITLSGSGNSKNVINATKSAREIGVNTLAICGYDGGELKSVSDNCIWVRCNDMQICEDIQVVFGHMVMKSLCRDSIYI